MVLWGHPVTTGAASVDYFVSSDAYHLDGGGGGSEGAAVTGSEGAQGAEGMDWSILWRKCFGMRGGV